MNPHDLRHYPLKIACLPIPPPGHFLNLTNYQSSLFFQQHATLVVLGLPVLHDTSAPARRLPIPPPGHFFQLLIQTMISIACTALGLLPFTALVLPVRRLPIPPLGHFFSTSNPDNDIDSVHCSRAPALHSTRTSCTSSTNSTTWTFLTSTINQ